MDLVYLLSAAAGAWILLWFAWRGRRWARGGPAPDQLGWRAGLARLAGYLLTHRKIRADRYAGWMHLLIFWGFVTLLAATTLVGIQHHLGWKFLTGTTYLVFSLGADLGGVALAAGLGMALWRRRTPAAHGRLLPGAATTLFLWLLLAVTLTGFLVEGARIARDFPPFERWSPAGYLTALALDGVGLGGAAAPPLHLGLWVGHALLAVVFFAVIPVTLLKHIPLAAYSVARPAGRPGLLHEPA